MTRPNNQQQLEPMGKIARRVLSVVVAIDLAVALGTLNVDLIDR